MRILDVGSGRTVRIPCNDDAEITFLDNSPDTLVGRKVPGRRFEALLGDAQDFDYGDRRFDVAVFWNVLEHIPRPETALRRACDRLDDNGFLIVGGPELRSLKAWITRNTPHLVHVLYYRWVMGRHDAGRDGRSPCPVEHKSGAGREALIEQLGQMDLAVRFEMRYVGNQITALRRFSRPLYWAYSGASALLRALTRNRVGSRETEFILVAQRVAAARQTMVKPDAAPAREERLEPALQLP